MKTMLKVIATACILTALLNWGSLAEYLHWNETEEPSSLDSSAASMELEPAPRPDPDSLYVWDEERYDWVVVDEANDPLWQIPQVSTGTKSGGGSTEDPVKLDWETLTDIRYRSRYFAEVDMEMFAPVFSDVLKSLDGQFVSIEGYAVPMYEEADRLAVSAFPYAACFFCGQASPASVISVYLSAAGKSLRLDDFRTFIGRLKLNHDDPNEFYYILEETRISP